MIRILQKLVRFNISIFLIIVIVVFYTQQNLEGKSFPMWTQYFISLLNFQLFYGFLDSYAASKDSIQQEFGVSDTFFGKYNLIVGILDMFSLIFRCFLAAYIIIYPFKKLKMTNFMLSILQFIGSGIMALSHWVPDWHKFLLIFGTILTGIGRGNISLIYLVSFQNIDGRQNKKAFNIWSVLTVSGTAYGLLSALLFIYALDLNWSVSFMIYNCIYLLSSVIFFIKLKEVQVSEQNRSFINTIRLLKSYYGKQHSNWLLLLDFVVISNFLLTQFFWAPFFFSKLGYIQASIYISLSIPIGALVSSFTILVILNQFYRFRSIITIVLGATNVIILITTLFLGDDSQDIIYYILLFLISSIITTGPFSLTFGSQFSQKVQQTQQRYLVMSFMRLCRQLFTALMMVVMGVVMEIDDKNYLYYLIVNLLLYLLIHIARRIMENRENAVQKSYQPLD